MCNHGWVFAKTCTINCSLGDLVISHYIPVKWYRLWNDYAMVFHVLNLEKCGSSSWKLEMFRVLHYLLRHHFAYWSQIQRQKTAGIGRTEDICLKIGHLKTIVPYFHHFFIILTPFIMFSHRWPPIGQLPCHHFGPDLRLRRLTSRSQDRNRRRRKDPKAVQKGDHRPRARAKAAWIGLAWCG